MKYHTALKKEGYEPKDEQIDPVYNFEKDNNFVFQSDITCGRLPVLYNQCDIFYAEIPWEHGYLQFINKAGQGNSEYSDFIQALRRIIELGKPTVILGGKALGKLLPEPAGLFPTNLMHGSYAFAYCYNIELPIFAKSNEIVEYLADHFERLGNFCCGYGYSGNIFRRKGKKYVMSDINPYCIGYIKNHYENLQ